MECFNNWQKGLGVLFTKGKLFQLSVHSCYFCCFLCFRKHRKISLLAHEVFVLIDYHWALWEIRTLNPSRISVELQHSGDSPRFQSKEFNSEGLQLWHNESTELMFQHSCWDGIEGHIVNVSAWLFRSDWRALSELWFAFDQILLRAYKVNWLLSYGVCFWNGCFEWMVASLHSYLHLPDKEGVSGSSWGMTL